MIKVVTFYKNECSFDGKKYEPTNASWMRLIILYYDVMGKSQARYAYSIYPDAYSTLGSVIEWGLFKNLQAVSA